MEGRDQRRGLVGTGDGARRVHESPRSFTGSASFRRRLRTSAILTRRFFAGRRSCTAQAAGSRWLVGEQARKSTRFDSKLLPACTGTRSELKLKYWV